MQLALIVFTLVALAELTTFSSIPWQFHKLYSSMVIVALIICNIWMITEIEGLAFILLSYFSLYRLVNLARVYKTRMQIDYLKSSSSQASAYLIFFQLVICVIYRLIAHTNINAIFIYLYAIAQSAVLIVMYATLKQNKLRLVPNKIIPVVNQDLPTLTVAIPARNETFELEKCLNSLITTSYPKLEIIVLDDSSQNKRTPEIIRSYAQHGVRFIPGEVPPEDWLAKNFAYRQLAREANGEIILYCGVDTNFQRDTITKAIGLMVEGSYEMVCLAPENRLESSAGAFSVILQTCRYIWELGLPRRVLSRPPVLSTCWLIKKNALKKAGGFDAVSRKIIPESYFARHANQNAKYGFFLAGGLTGLISQKSCSEQKATTIRTRYPQLHRRLELVALVTLGELLILVASPFCLLVATIFVNYTLAIIFAINTVLTLVLFSTASKLTFRSPRQSAFLTFAAFMNDVCMLNYSLWQYEFGEVLWKGRNVCIPVMRTSDIDPTASSV